MSLLCSLGRHKLQPIKGAETSKTAMFAEIMELVFRDAESDLYKYVFKALKNEYNSNERIQDTRCVRCGLIKYNRVFAYKDIVHDITKKADEFESIEKAKKMANNLCVSGD